MEKTKEYTDFLLTLTWKKIEEITKINSETKKLSNKEIITLKKTVTKIINTNFIPNINKPPKKEQKEIIKLICKIYLVAFTKIQLESIKKIFINWTNIPNND